ncbi:hypothetical protein ACO0RG_001646 [Hanseniaspora osmophila]|uniref:Sporulation-specific protein 2 n=1 Tax=Hanseniaspora osmophila TaxID=56408 RepID=A0A1E5RHV3_9ASCO|nr:Sporulation-specific protein 2 [Hanseniaspora osmophila]
MQMNFNTSIKLIVLAYFVGFIYGTVVPSNKIYANNSIPQDKETTALPEICSLKKHEVSDAYQLQGLQMQCSTLSGDLVFQNYIDPMINLGNIKIIQGSLTVEESSSLVRIEAPQLQEVGHDFKLKRLTSLTSIYMENLSTVDTILWKVLPILSTAQLGPSLKKTTKIIISDTSLTSFDGCHNLKNLSILNLNNNRFMEEITCNVESVSEQLSIAANARDVEISLKELQWANNITIRESAKIELPKLESVKNSMEFIDNYFSTLKIPNLETIGGTLGLLENRNLKTIDINNLTDVSGGIMISKNSQLKSINFFSKLQQIGGAIQFDGTIDKVEFPKLKLVKGSVSIISDSDDLDCSQWTSPKNGVSIIRGGKITCSSLKKETNISLNENGEILDSDEVEKVKDDVEGRDSKSLQPSNSASSKKANKTSSKSKTANAALSNTPFSSWSLGLILTIPLLLS